jgi:cellulose synthase/poly-beta-1,6-N-acetylglucosamine synthase-like glycosyltransferase
MIFSLLYPVWIFYNWRNEEILYQKSEQMEGISIIYLSYNGFQYLPQKIEQLFIEIEAFNQSEIIIIDDGSCDETPNFLKNFHHPKVKIILKEIQKGIPDSMNEAVEFAQFPYIVFCDQRQTITKGSIRKMVLPLQNEEIGAVSSLLSAKDKKGKYSIIRIIENFIKSKESRIGKLIGVYGPLYAIKKECYHTIPKDIILDDLYLSLQILKTKKIILHQEAIIVDENCNQLYNYQRIKRYLTGLFQIISQQNLISKLPVKEKWMLLWHKYLKLLIPISLFIVNILLGVLALHDISFLVLFIFINILGVTSIVLSIFKLHSKYQSLLCINILYIIALLDIICQKLAHTTQSFFKFHEK